MFMPPSSHQFSFLFSSLHFRPSSPLSPPVNYLLSVQLGQELHFLPDGGLKGRKKEGLSAVVSVGCASSLEREETEKILISQTVFLNLC